MQCVSSPAGTSLLASRVVSEDCGKFVNSSSQLPVNVPGVAGLSWAILALVLSLSELQAPMATAQIIAVKAVRV